MEDRYEILDVVAHGAMATVWRAQDARLGRVVAIKRPHATQDGGTNDPAFAAAARSAAAVTHPNLITIFDTGTDEIGTYVVMEFIDGPTLAEMGGASGGVAALGSDIASGLAALHAAGIVHRGVRPSNIVLGPTGPKLTNFGTARTLEATTRSNGAAPRFEAPEVLAGTEPGKPADVYALGAVLAWLASQTSPGQALSSVVDQAMTEEPETRPTAATLSERLFKIAATSVTAVRTAPLAAAPPNDDATRHFDSAPAPASEEPVSEPEPPKRGRRLAVLIAVIVVALIVVVMAPAGDEDPLSAAVDTTTVDPAATTTAASSAGTPASDTTVPEESGGVFSTVRIFVTFIRETPRNVLTSSGAEEIISNVTDGVSEATRGNDGEAESNFADAVETVQEEIESETVVDRAIELITRLARQLGLDVEGVIEPTG